MRMFWQLEIKNLEFEFQTKRTKFSCQLLCLIQNHVTVNHPFASASFKAKHYCITTEHLSYLTKLKKYETQFLIYLKNSTEDKF